MTERQRPTQLVQIGILLVFLMGALMVVAVAGFGIAGLDELGPAPSLAVAAYRVELAPSRVVLSMVLVGGFGLGVATLIMWRSGREFTEELSTVEAGIQAMVRDDALVASPPLRTLDELGALVRSFDALRLDFGVALENERRLRREAEQAETARAEFLRAVSHELRTPLNAILGFADVLIAEIDGPLTDAQREDLEIVRSAGKHLLDLFTDVIDLSEAATDKLRLEKVRLAVPPLVEEVAKEIRGLKRAGALSIVVESGDEVPLVSGDPKRLRQVITNLAANAVKFTKEGSVTMRVNGTVDGDVLIEVVDTGIGIPEAEQDRVFAEFGQALATGSGGSGLGLAIAKRLVELHGGHLELESIVDEGSRFIVTLPGWEEP